MSKYILPFLSVLFSFYAASAAPIQCDLSAAKSAAEWEINFKGHLCFIGEDVKLDKEPGSDQIQGYKFEFVRVLIDEERNLADAVNGKVYVPVNPDGSCGQASAIGQSMSSLPRR